MRSTTIYIEKELLQKIKNLSLKSGKTQSFIIKSLLKRVCTKTKDIKASTGLTQYQNHLPEKEFVRFHIDFDDNEIWEIRTTALNLKLSVSNMLYISSLFFLNFLSKIFTKNIKQTNKNTYSYTFSKTLHTLYISFKYGFIKERLLE